MDGVREAMDMNVNKPGIRMMSYAIDPQHSIVEFAVKHMKGFHGQRTFSRSPREAPH